MNVHLLNRWATLLLLAAFLGGCAFRPQLHAVAIDHNRLVADSANELTLLNILRARDRQPMHFTSMNVLRGNAQVNISGSVGAFFDEDGSQTIAPSLGVEALSNPSFDIVVYDKQDFQNGIMRPVEPRLYQYFLSNGWPADYLARLLIEQIEFRTQTSAVDEGGVLVATLENDPGNAAKAEQFGRFLAQYDLEIRTSRAPPTPLAAASELLARSTLAELSVLTEGDLYIEQEGEHAGMIMRRGAVEYAAALVETDPSAGSAYACAADSAPGSGDAQGSRSSAASFQFLAPRAVTSTGPACTFDGTPVAPPLIVLRSPDAVLYYLGEVLRASGGTGESGLLKVWRQDEPDVPSRRAVVRTRFMGERYAILEEPEGAAGEPGGRSMQTLSFLQQLINLHKSAQELPVSSALMVQR
jgi:hypothetical protein